MVAKQQTTYPMSPHILLLTAQVNIIIMNFFLGKVTSVTPPPNITSTSHKEVTKQIVPGGEFSQRGQTICFVVDSLIPMWEDWE